MTRCLRSSHNHTSTVASLDPETIKAVDPVASSAEYAKHVTTSRCPNTHCDNLPGMEEMKNGVEKAKTNITKQKIIGDTS